MQTVSATSQKSTTGRPARRGGVRTPLESAMRVVRPAVRVVEQLGNPASTWLCERLFLTPVPRRPRLKDAERGAQAKGARRELFVDDRRLVGWQWGSGDRAVLLVHGWGGHGLQLQAFVEPLVARGFTVASFDLPSHGESEGKRTNVIEFGAALSAISRELPPLAAVVAHSLGGAAVMGAMARGQLEADRLALIAGPAHFHTARERFLAMTGISERTFQGMRSKIERRTGLNWTDIEPMNVAPRLRVPGLIVHADNDEELPFEHAETLSRLWPNAKLSAKTALGHYRILRDPQVVEEVVAFAAG
jgi:pimeloyl-ACP methyl ester carboxylesterase